VKGVGTTGVIGPSAPATRGVPILLWNLIDSQNASGNNREVREYSLLRTDRELGASHVVKGSTRGQEATATLVWSDQLTVDSAKVLKGMEGKKSAEREMYRQAVRCSGAKTRQCNEHHI
jgi:hypothetical protein